ncbi:MAG: D-alanine--D-alanine ligase [Gammaproteobacteria bacterium]|nr:D-alanine--D-alanine ligase [Gammaproteobacteria bacterium]
MTDTVDSTAYGKVAVLMGGLSAERDVSLNSGNAVVEALQKHSINAQGIDVDTDILTVLAAGNYDRAFIALHGRGGEDGTIQGALELLGLPYTGSGVMASALGMDKLRTKQLWLGQRLPTPGFALLTDDFDADAIVQHYGLPLIVKPAHEGSSIGMTKVSKVDQLRGAYFAAKKYDHAVFVERWITGSEYTVAVLGDQALPAIRLETPNDFYDYDAKYVVNTTAYHIPCGLPAMQEQALQQLAITAFKGVGASGWGRVDLLCDSAGEPYLIEINTVPGLTDHSLVPMAANAVGITFEALVVRILQQTLN